MGGFRKCTKKRPHLLAHLRRDLERADHRAIAVGSIQCRFDRHNLRVARRGLHEVLGRSGERMVGVVHQHVAPPDGVKDVAAGQPCVREGRPLGELEGRVQAELAAELDRDGVQLCRSGRGTESGFRAPVRGPVGERCCKERRKASFSIRFFGGTESALSGPGRIVWQSETACARHRTNKMRCVSTRINRLLNPSLVSKQLE